MGELAHDTKLDSKQDEMVGLAYHHALFLQKNLQQQSATFEIRGRGAKLSRSISLILNKIHRSLYMKIITHIWVFKFHSEQGNRTERWPSS